MGGEKKNEKNYAEKIFFFAEILIFAVITVCIVVTALSVFTGWPITKIDIYDLISTLDDRWRIGLIVLVPLFYRPIRGFLLRVVKAGSVEAPHPKEEENIVNPSQEG